MNRGMKTRATVTRGSSYSRPFRVVTDRFDPQFVGMAALLKGKWDQRQRAWYFGDITVRLYEGLCGLYGKDQVSWCQDVAGDAGCGSIGPTTSCGACATTAAWPAERSRCTPMSRLTQNSPGLTC